MLIEAEYIKRKLTETLPGKESHKKMLPENRILEVRTEDIHQIKHSSVLLLLYIENKELQALLIKRPQHMKYHAGQIALPGGKIEKGESPLETAYRETWEEIGVTSDKIEIIGKLSELFVEVSRFQIHPFVGWLDKKPKLNINKNEVEKTIQFPINNLSKPTEEAEIKTFTGILKVPCLKFENEIIWGATAMILSEFYDVIQSAISTNQ